MLHSNLFPKDVGHPINGRTVLPHRGIKHHEALIRETGIRVGVEVFVGVLVAEPHLDRIRIQQLFVRVLPPRIQKRYVLRTPLLQNGIYSLFLLHRIFIAPVLVTEGLDSQVWDRVGG